jgi:hypothetical protein
VTHLGSLAVPFHLRNAADRRMKTHGIGVGYRYPPEFDGSDVDQQYLPDDLRERRYYQPLDQGYEVTIGQRMEARAEARRNPPKKATPPPGQGQWHAPGDIMGTRETARKRLADTERRDAKG